MKIQVEKEYIYALLSRYLLIGGTTPLLTGNHDGGGQLVTVSLKESAQGISRLLPWVSVIGTAFLNEMAGHVERCYPFRGHSVSPHSEKTCDLRQCQCGL